MVSGDRLLSGLIDRRLRRLITTAPLDAAAFLSAKVSLRLSLAVPITVFIPTSRPLCGRITPKARGISVCNGVTVTNCICRYRSPGGTRFAAFLVRAYLAGVLEPAPTGIASALTFVSSRATPNGPWSRLARAKRT